MTIAVSNKVRAAWNWRTASPSEAALDPALFHHALERSLFPVFVVLLVLAVVVLFVAGLFPARAD